MPKPKTSSEVELMETYTLGGLIAIKDKIPKTSSEVELMETQIVVQLNEPVTSLKLPRKLN